jgi:hypothetical protein
MNHVMAIEFMGTFKEQTGGGNKSIQFSNAPGMGLAKSIRQDFPENTICDGLGV